VHFWGSPYAELMCNISASNDTKTEKEIISHGGKTKEKENAFLIVFTK
jgi:hypothetical protein